MELDESKLIKSNLLPTLYVALYAIYYDKQNLIQYFKNKQLFDKIIEQLEKEGYVKIIGPDKAKDYVVRNKTLSLLGKNLKVNDWYEEWRNLFPSGTNSGGYHHRGNKQEVLKKLTKFVEKNRIYSKEQIMNATKNYIIRCSAKNSYMMLAHYFIDKKEVGSTLLTELEFASESKFEVIKRTTAI